GLRQGAGGDGADGVAAGGGEGRAGADCDCAGGEQRGERDEDLLGAADAGGGGGVGVHGVSPWWCGPEASFAAGLMSRNLRGPDPQEPHVYSPVGLWSGHGWQPLDTAVSRSLRTPAPYARSQSWRPSGREVAPVARAKKQGARPSAGPMNPMAEQVGPEFYDAH